MGRILVLLLVGLAIACSSPSPATDAGTPGPSDGALPPTDATPAGDVPRVDVALDSNVSARVELAAFEERYVGAVCDRVFVCPGAGFENARLYLRDPMNCRATMTPLGGAPLGVEASLRSLIQGAQAGTIVRYDATAAARCIAATAMCSALLRVTACRDVFQGTVAADGMCYQSEECRPGNYCSLGCPGTCRPQVPLGSPCSSAEECAPPRPGSAVDCIGGTMGMGGRCVEVGEAPPVGEGQECGSDTIGGVRVNTPCQGELACRPGRCVRPFAEGEMCSGGCASGLACVGELPSTMRCRRLVVHAQAGEPCEDTADRSDVCNTYQRLTCVGNVCQSAEAGRESAACGLRLPCAPGFACNFEMSQCFALLPTDAPCTRSTDCVSSYCLRGRCAGRLCESLFWPRRTTR